MPKYVLPDVTTVQLATQRGLEQYEFAAGTVESPTEDELYVLAYFLAPGGMAEEVADAPAPRAPARTTATDAPATPAPTKE